MTHKLGAVLYPQFELLDLYGPLEMFGCLAGSVEIITVAAQAGPVASTPGVATVADHSFADCPELDSILVPGGIGTFPALADEGLIDFLQKRASSASRVMSVCTGSALLAYAGMLDDRRATTNKLYFDLVRAQGDKVNWVESARWVTDGKFVTSSGVSAGTDMALAVIADLFGREKADQVALMTEYVWQDDATNDPFAAHLNQGDMSQLSA